MPKAGGSTTTPHRCRVPKFKKNRVETYSPKGKRDFTIADNVRNFLGCPQFFGRIFGRFGRGTSEASAPTLQVDFQNIDSLPYV